MNRWFAVSSVLMTASILWLIIVDYDRPWHAYQERYFVGKAALAHLDYVNASTGKRRREIGEAEVGLAAAKERAALKGAGARMELVDALADADLAFRKAEAPWARATQVLQVTRDAYERTLGEHGPDDRRTKAAHSRLRIEEQEIAELQQTKEKWEDQKELEERELAELDAPVLAAQKRLSALQRVAEAARQKDQQFRGVLSDEGLLGKLPIVKALINFPLIDFAAPKGTPGRLQINQLVLPDVRQELNYLQTYTTDRCTTCHICIQDPEFSKERLVAKLEEALPSINEILQGTDQPPLEFPTPPTLPGSGQELPPGQISKRWAELEPQQQDLYFTELLETVNGYFRQSGRKTIDLGQPLLAHPDLDLYVSLDSPHPMATMGCTVCHEGNPQETDFVLAAHTPPTHEVEKGWKHAYYDRRAGIVNTTFETVLHYWDRPMLLLDHTEASCAKCHTDVSEIGRFRGERKGGRINLGRFLFTSTGCVNCHKVDTLDGSPRVGPDLRHAASKLRPEFMQQWIYSPKKFRPATRMPHFFMQENNRAQSANSFDTDPVGRTQTEVAAITKYLFETSKEWEPLKPPAGVTGDAERGRKLFREVGCLACHANLTELGEEMITGDLVHRLGMDEQTAAHRSLGMTHEERSVYAMEHFVNDRDTFLHPETTRFDPEKPYNTPVLTRFAPELSGVGSKVSFEWLYSWLMDPTRYSKETKMPGMRLHPSEAADLATYLMTMVNPTFQQGEFAMNSERLAKVDELVFMLLSTQRSAAHSRAILEDKESELTDMLVSLLARSFGREEVPRLGKEQALSWGKQKAYDLIRPMSLQDKKTMYLGNKMIAHYGCYACHQIRGFEDTTPPGTDLSKWRQKPIAQLDFAFYDHAFHHMREKKKEIYGHVYPLEADQLNYWSPGENAKEQITHTHAAFAKHKMLNPRIWDREKIKQPYDKLKMPNYYFTEEEADALTTFLLSRVERRVSDALIVDYAGGTLGPIARGRDLTRELNCVACHQIEDNAPTIQQYFRRTVAGELEFDSVNAPPSLWGEGAKVQHAWLHRFLQHVEPLRPWLQVRMPSFHLTGEEATTLVQYFAALSQRDAGKLADNLSKIGEYLESNPTRSGDESTAASDSHEASPWFRVEGLQEEAEGLRRFAIERELMRPTALEMFSQAEERLADAHAELLERTRFMQKLYDVEYPFVEPPRPLSDDARFALGGEFFADMGCLSCHVLGRMETGPATTTDQFVQMYRLDNVSGEGDQAIAILNGQPYPVGSVIDGFTLTGAENVYYDGGDVETKAFVEGPNAQGETERIMLQAPSAPNLSLTHRRLRRQWVFNWMLQPGWIEPGTKMPQNFADGQSPFAGDERYPGSGIDHINLLVDYLYDAGTRGTRAPLPKIIAADPSEEFDDEGFDFDDE